MATDRRYDTWQHMLGGLLLLSLPCGLCEALGGGAGRGSVLTAAMMTLVGLALTKNSKRSVAPPPGAVSMAGSPSALQPVGVSGPTCVSPLGPRLSDHLLCSRVRDSST